MTTPRWILHAGVMAAVAYFAAMWPRTVDAQVKLEYKFPEGQKLTYKTTSRARQVLTFGGNNINVSKRETKVWSRSVGKRNGDSTLPIEEKVLSLRVEYNFPDGHNLTLDSSEPQFKIEDRQLAFLGDVVKLESQIAYTVLLDNQKKLKAIAGTEKLKERVRKIEDPVVREELNSEIGDQRLKRKFEQVLLGLPDAPAKSGEPWERTELLEINGKAFTVRKKFEYQGTEKKGDKTLDKISCKLLDAKYDVDPDGKLPMKVTKSDLKVESSEGSILFDRESGHVASATERFRLKGNMTYTGGGGDQAGGFELSFDSNTQLQPPP
jgi:Family of unknown function (DUF6263)